MKKNKHAVFFTIDSMVALAAAMVFMFAIFYYLSVSPDYSSEDLRVFAQDALAVLEKSGAMNDNSVISGYINATPSQVCLNITVFNPAESSFVKPGCSMADVRQISVATRVFINNKNPRYAKAMVWYNN